MGFLVQDPVVIHRISTYVDKLPTADTEYRTKFYGITSNVRDVWWIIDSATNYGKTALILSREKCSLSNIFRTYSLSNVNLAIMLEQLE